MVHGRAHGSLGRRRRVAARIALAALVFLWSGSVFALDPSLDVSQYAHTAWRIRDGFPRGRVGSIAQTPDGYLWLGTELGLFRFDGVRAVPWQPAEGQLPSNRISSLLVARDGTLWIGTFKGLASWKDGRLTTYAELRDRFIIALIQDRDGTVWAGAAAPGGLCAVQAGKARCEADGEFGGQVPDLYEDHLGNLWLSASTGVWRWKPGPPDKYELPPGAAQASALIEDDNGALLVAATDGLRRLTGRQIESHPLPVVDPAWNPLRLFRSTDGSLWIGTLHGLVHVHQGRTDAFGVGDGLSGAAVIRIYEDREKNVWVGTAGGLDRFREYAFPTITANQGLSSSYPWAVQATPDGSVWIATPEGLNRWKDGHVTFHGKQTAVARGSAVPLLDGVPRSLGVDDRGRLWAATNEAVFHLDGDRFVRAPRLPGGNVWSVAPDRRGNTWVGVGYQALFQGKPDGTAEEFAWRRFGRPIGAVAVLPDASPGGGLWLGFYEGGVSQFRDGQVTRSYTAADGLGAGRVTGLRFGEHGTIWAATEGGLSWIRDAGVLTLTAKNGLPCDPTHWSIEDDVQFVWIYMPCGLVRVARSELDAWGREPKRTIQATVFDAGDGVGILAAVGSWGPPVTKAADGRIWFTSSEGVTVIDPRRLPHNDVPPPVHIERVTVDGMVYDPAAGSIGRLRLPPRVHDLIIDYTALSLVVPEKLRFRVKLEGQDEDWRERGNDRRARYTNLSPKDYRFRVKASNDSGVWNEEGTFLDFTIAPAFFETAWFRVLCVAAAAALLWAADRVRVGVLERHRRLLEQHQMEITALNERLMKAQEEERSRIAGELHDGIVQQMTTVNTLLGVATMQLPPDSRTKATIDKVQDIVMAMGSDVRHLSHELHPGLLKEAGLPEALCSYCKEFSTTRGIPVTCEADSGVEDLSPGTALTLYRIAQEALGNAAKHSKAKQVRVRLLRADEVVRLIVSDDGVGFVLGRPGDSRGVGLVNMRERVRYLNGTFELETQPGHGTTIRAEVPFRPA